MELIRRIESRRDRTGKCRCYGIFKCPHCGKEVEKVIDDGRRNKSCGCYKISSFKRRVTIHGDAKSCKKKDYIVFG